MGAGRQSPDDPDELRIPDFTSVDQPGVIDALLDAGIHPDVIEEMRSKEGTVYFGV